MLRKSHLNLSLKDDPGSILDEAEPQPKPIGLNVVIGQHNKDDELIGTQKDESMFGLSGDDRMEGRAGNDHMDGGLGDDQLFGGKDDDTVIGGAGSDIVAGGEGNDVLWGHGPSLPHTPLSAVEVDTFLFDSNDWGHDTIMDFQDGVDLIQFLPSSGVTYVDLQITQDANGTTISYDYNGVQSSILLDGFTGIIDQNDFIF